MDLRVIFYGIRALIWSLVIIPMHGSYFWEKKLYTTLLSDYSTSIRPSEIPRQPLQVEFQIELTRIRSYNLKDQVLELTAFTMMKWTDTQLAWNADDYNGTDRMNFDSSEIWTPDIVLYNTAYEERESWTDTYPSKAIVLTTGEVIWNMPVIWYATCQSDITWFPLDQQECRLDFGSWSYSYSQLELVAWKSNTSHSQILPNGEWEIYKTEKTYLNESFTCCPEAFSMMRYTIIMNHLYSFYFIYIILPLIALCIMFLLIFFIPRGDRLGFGMTVILSITVYLLVISEKLPEKSDVTPMLGAIFTGEFFILCFAVAITSVSVTLSSRKGKPTSNFLRRIGRINSSSPEKSFVEMTERNKPSRRENLENIRTERESLSPKKVLDFEKEWQAIADQIDWLGFIFTATLLILLPIIVIASLDKAGLQ